jgi:hypothetical protein
MLNSLSSRQDIHVIGDKALVLVETITASQIRGRTTHHFGFVKVTEGMLHV